MTSLIRTITVTLLAVLLSPINVSADMFQPSHLCRKPSKPFEFTSQYELDSFNDDVKRYKRCISDFVEEQNEASKRHLQAGQEAIDDWNRYVKFELNR